MVQTDNPSIIFNVLDPSSTPGSELLNVMKIIEKVVDEFGVNIAICPPLAYLALCKEKSSLQILTQIENLILSQNLSFYNTFELLKLLKIDGVILNQPNNELSIGKLEELIRYSRTHRFFTLVYSNNVAVSAAITKLDPNGIIFSYSGDWNSETPISKSTIELIENQVKRINLENPRVSPFCGEGVFGRIDVEKALELGIKGFVIDLGYSSSKDYYQYVTSLITPLIKK